MLIFALVDQADCADFLLIKKPHQSMRLFTISKWSVPVIEDQRQSAFWLRHYRSTARSS